MISLVRVATPADGLAIAAGMARPGPFVPDGDEAGVIETPRRKFSVKCNTPQQADFVTDTTTYIVAAVGGVGSGKTVGLDYFIAMQFWREQGTGTVGGIFANTYRQLEQSTLPSLWETFDAMGLVDGRDYVYNKMPPRAWAEFRSAFKDHGGVLSIRRWGQAVVRSLENFQMTRGLTLGWAAVDELRDARSDAFLEILKRVRCPKAVRHLIRIATTPNGFDWIHDELVAKAATMPPEYARRLITMRTRDNPALKPEYYQSLRASMDPKTAEQELDGKFVATHTGAVYHQFDRERHMRATTPDFAVPWFVTLDFNRTPFCAIIGQEIDSRLVVHDEIVLRDAGSEEMAEAIVARLGKLGWARQDGTPVEVYGDPAGNQRTTKSHESDWHMIQRTMTAAIGGAFVKRWRREVYNTMDSINATNRMLRSADGRERVLISPKCVALIRDLELVRFREGTSEIDKTNKMLTHPSDAFRYLIQERYPIRPRTGGRIWT